MLLGLLDHGPVASNLEVRRGALARHVLPHGRAQALQVVDGHRCFGPRCYYRLRMLEESLWRRPFLPNALQPKGQALYIDSEHVPDDPQLVLLSDVAGQKVDQGIRSDSVPNLEVVLETWAGHPKYTR
eukprot:1638052-Pyramimonas_sp.AAC.2